MSFLLSIDYLFWLILSAVFFACGEFLSKKFALDPKLSVFLALFLFYNLGVLAWLPAIRQKNMLAIVGAIWSVLSLLATVCIGVLVFKERLNVFGVIGIFVAIAAIILLSLG